MSEFNPSSAFDDLLDEVAASDAPTGTVTRGGSSGGGPRIGATYTPAPRVAYGTHTTGDLSGRTVEVPGQRPGSIDRVDPYSGQRYAMGTDGTWREAGFARGDEVRQAVAAAGLPMGAKDAAGQLAASVGASANPMIRDSIGKAGMVGTLQGKDAPTFNSMHQFDQPGLGFDLAHPDGSPAMKEMSTPNSINTVRYETPIARRDYGFDFGHGPSSLGFQSSGPAALPFEQAKFAVPDTYVPGPNGRAGPDNTFSPFNIGFNIGAPTMPNSGATAPQNLTAGQTVNANGSVNSPVFTPSVYTPGGYTGVASGGAAPGPLAPGAKPQPGGFNAIGKPGEPDSVVESKGVGGPDQAAALEKFGLPQMLGNAMSNFNGAGASLTPEFLKGFADAQKAQGAAKTAAAAPGAAPKAPAAPPAAPSGPAKSTYVPSSYVPSSYTPAPPGGGGDFKQETFDAGQLGHAGVMTVAGPQTVNINGGKSADGKTSIGFGYNPTMFGPTQGRNLSNDVATRAVQALQIIDQQNQSAAKGISPLANLDLLRAPSDVAFGGQGGAPQAGGAGNQGSGGDNPGAFGGDGPVYDAKGGTVKAEALPMGRKDGRPFDKGGTVAAPAPLETAPVSAPLASDKGLVPDPAGTPGTPGEPAIAPPPVETGPTPPPVTAGPPPVTPPPVGTPTPLPPPTGTPNPVDPDALAPYQDALNNQAQLNQRRAGDANRWAAAKLTPTAVEDLGATAAARPLPPGVFLDPTKAIQSAVDTIKGYQQNLTDLGNPGSEADLSAQDAALAARESALKSAQGYQQELQSLAGTRTPDQINADLAALSSDQAQANPNSSMTYDQWVQAMVANSQKPESERASIPSWESIVASQSPNNTNRQALEQELQNSQTVNQRRMQLQNLLQGMPSDVSGELGTIGAQRASFGSQLTNARRAAEIRQSLANTLAAGVPGQRKPVAAAAGGTFQARPDGSMVKDLPMGKHSMVTPEQIVGIGVKTGKTYFTLGEKAPEVATKTDNSTLNIKPIKGAKYPNPAASLPMGAAAARAA